MATQTSSTSVKLRGDLPPLPARIASLPVDERGYPVPWFVAWPDGKPEFRCMDGEKWERAVQDRLCWVCGQPLGRYMVFTIGPMCAVNRVSSEPPSHKECAEFSVRACPFLSKPQMVRRENDMPAASCSPAGMPILRNPGVIVLWVTREYSTFGDGNGGVLLSLGEPYKLTWWTQARTATRAEILDSMEAGLPSLRLPAEMQGADAVAHLEKMVVAAHKLLPKE